MKKKILVCIMAVFAIALMSSCSKAKVAGAVQLMNALIQEPGVEFSTEGKNVVMKVHGKFGEFSEEMRADDEFRNSQIEYYKNDSAFRNVTEDLFPLCKEADYEYFIVRYVDSISSDTMNILIPFEEL